MKFHVSIFILLSLMLSSCFKEDNYGNSKRDNFELLWKIIDERYCFFESKEIDWDEVYDRYSPMISDNMSNDALFEVLGTMLAELQDGHVNLVAPHDLARYWKWFEDYPDNFDEKTQRNYIGTDYQIASGLKYKILADNIGYIHYASFLDPIGTGNIHQVISRLASCDGIILDLRNNGGGLLSYSERLASYFINEKTHVGYIQHKTAKGHDNFSKPYKLYVEPGKGMRYQKQLVLLTNRRCYSAANDFVNAMRYAPNAITVGDKTGGGSGLPFSSELPNGWSVRFSASPMYNADMEHLEFGIEPDIKVDMTKEDMDQGLDTIIETAIKIIKE